MDSLLRVVTQLPLDELWNDHGPVDAARGQDLAVPDVRACLREGACGVVATIGERLRWLQGVELFDWWKAEAKPRLLDPRTQTVEVADPSWPGAERPEHAWRLEDFPDERAWRASRWRLSNGSTAVVFEEFH